MLLLWVLIVAAAWAHSRQPHTTTVISLVRRCLGLRQIAWQARTLKLSQLESCRILLPHIVTGGEREHVLREVDEFTIARVIEVRDDRHTIIQLEAEGVNWVVHEDHVFEVTVANDSQVLDEDAVHSLETMLSVQPEIDQGAIWVNQVDHRIGVLTVACREHPHMVLGGALGQAFSQMRAQVYPRLDRLLDTWPVGVPHDCDGVLRLFTELAGEAWRVSIFFAVEAVRQSLIEVENKSLGLPAFSGWR